jgi:predicted ATPase
MIQFLLIDRGKTPPETGKNTAYLQIDYWNDFSFVTMFYLSVHDENGQKHEIGDVKIASKGQETTTSTFSLLGTSFSHLEEVYFSLGQSVDYYQKLSNLPMPLKEEILKALNDMVFNPSFIDIAQNENVFRTSLLRDLSLSVIKGQFNRALLGYPPLTDFKFSFVRPEQKDMSGVRLDFKVKESSKPSTNIHAIIGRNGVGKTTLLNNMIDAIIRKEKTESVFLNKMGDQETTISSDYFSSLVSVSFSAFDPFEPPEEQHDPSKGTCYFYVGLKDIKSPEIHRTIESLRKDCAEALADCFRRKDKAARWRSAIAKLGSDENFDNMRLEILEEKYHEVRRQTPANKQSDSREFIEKYFLSVNPFLRKMSSGHAIVLLTITRLVATVEEKTLVLLDEPESHLHPPLLSAFIRALSDLLYDRNGVAIIATHSPVVLQEIPKSCVWKINRVGLSTVCSRPERQTFAENVGVLTREVFGLEVVRSGFYDLLISSVSKDKEYEEILEEYGGQLGMEGRAILKALVVYRSKEAVNDTDE